MKGFIKNFKYSEFKKDIKQVIKNLHVFDDPNGFNILFVTNDDNVSSFGSNNFGVCGLGHDNEVTDPQPIEELCNKQIQQFINGKTFVLCLTINKQLYGWGCNKQGELARGYLSDGNVFLKPLLITLKNESFIQISCGIEHTLALTSIGSVYVWGSNEYGQCGCGEEKGKYINIPIRLYQFDDNSAKEVYCSLRRSFVITITNQIYSWGGDDNWRSLGYESIKTPIYTPILVTIDNVNCVYSIRSSTHNTYFLTNNGIYFCGNYLKGKISMTQKTPKLLESDKEFTSLHSINCTQSNKMIVAAVCDKEIYNLFYDQILLLREHQTVFEYFMNDYKLIDNCQYLPVEKDQLREETVIEIIEKDFIKNYDIIEPLGQGTYGSVLKVKDMTNDKEFALKQIRIEDDEIDYIKREIENLFKTQSDFVVKLNDYWIERNICCILMELCSWTLKQILIERPFYFIRNKNQLITPFEYYILCEIMLEITESVEYIHSKNIIHRDIKPGNIFISKTQSNGKFIRLGDFGLARGNIYSGANSLTQFVGTQPYIAPEVKISRNYDKKSDVFSLGVLFLEILDCDIMENMKSSTFNNKLINLINYIEHKMKSDIPKERPRCKEIKNGLNNFLLSLEEIKQESSFSKNINPVSSQFFNIYINFKNNINKQW